MRLAGFYMALMLAANAAGMQAAAQGADPPAPEAPASGLAALREGDMRKLAVHEAPQAVPATPVETEAGEPFALSDLRGGVAVVNFWATWCAPCRVEMPTLAALQEAVGGDARVAVVAVGRNDPVEAERFLEEAGAANLLSLRDPRQELARDMGVLGLPVTVILDAEGREVARLQGDADWAGDDALAVVRAAGGA